MPEQNITNIPSNRVDFIDERTGLVSREWYRFFLNLFTLAGGGGNQISLDDLQVGPPPQADTPTSSGGGTGTVTSVAMSVPTGLSVAGSPITTSGTLAVTYGAGYAIPTTASQTQWDTAYTERLQWDGGATSLVAATGRTSLGATTVGSNFFTLPDPAAITFIRVNADNTVSTLDAATFRTAIGAGTGSGTVTSVAALTLGTTGTDLSSTVATGTTTPVITLNVPTASATNRGALSAADWTTFNSKGSGTVTAVSVVSANGFAGSSSGGATPALTLSTSITGVLKGNGTALSAATAGTDYSAGTSALATGILKSTTTTGALSIAVAADFPTLNQNTTGTASNVTGTVAIANGGTGQTSQTAAFDALAPTTTKGDLIVFNSTDNIRLPVGTDAYVLTADSTVAAGVKWAVAGSGSNNITAQGLWENNASITANYTIGTGNNALSSGPISVATGITVTVPTGSSWAIV